MTATTKSTSIKVNPLRGESARRERGERLLDLDFGMENGSSTARLSSRVRSSKCSDIKMQPGPVECEHYLFSLLLPGAAR